MLLFNVDLKRIHKPILRLDDIRPGFQIPTDHRIKYQHYFYGDFTGLHEPFLKFLPINLFAMTTRYWTNVLFANPPTGIDSKLVEVLTTAMESYSYYGVAALVSEPGNVYAVPGWAIWLTNDGMPILLYPYLERAAGVTPYQPPPNTPCLLYTSPSPRD